MKKITTLLSAAAAILATSAATAQCSNITFDVNTDDFGYETYWEVTPTGDPCGTNTVAAGGSVEVGCLGGGVRLQNTDDPALWTGASAAGVYGDNITINETIGCLTDGDCFDIHIVDDWGDGSASIDVYLEGELIESFDGSVIGAGTVWTFCVNPPANYDAEITNGAAYEYTQVPSFELNPAGNCIGDLEVTSSGLMDLTGVEVTVTVLQDLSPVHTETVTLGAIASGASANAAFAAYMPSAVGTYTVVYQVASTETDEDPSNNVWGYEFEVGTEIYARDNDAAIGSIGIGADGDGFIGNAFDVIDPYSILNGVQVMIDNTGNTLDGAAFDVEVFATDGTGVPTTSIATVSGTVGTTATNDWYDLNLATPLNLAAGRYVIALKETAGITTSFSYSNAVFTPGSVWVSWGGTTPTPWTLSEDLGFEITFMARGKFATSAAVAEMETLEVGLYPNPANDQITLSNIENGNAVEIINAEGKVVYSGAVNNAVETINVSNLEAGFYTVKVIGNNVIGINRFVKK